MQITVRLVLWSQVLVVSKPSFQLEEMKFVSLPISVTVEDTSSILKFEVSTVFAKGKSMSK